MITYRPSDFIPQAAPAEVINLNFPTRFIQSDTGGGSGGFVGPSEARGATWQVPSNGGFPPVVWIVLALIAAYYFFIVRK